MTRSISGTRHRAALLGGVALATALLVSGCGAGQIAETAAKAPSVSGVNVDSPAGSVLIRNLHVVYQGPEGYPAGGEAPLVMSLYNQSDEPVMVRITATPAAGPDNQSTLVSGSSVVFTDLTTPAVPPASPSAPVSPTAPASPTATGTASPSAPAASASPTTPPATATRPAVIEIPALGSFVISGTGDELLQVEGLNAALTPGKSVTLTFEFSNGEPPLVTTAPTGVPLSPAPRATSVTGDDGH
ncbi:hypothetical protein AB0I61_09585 [Polymorphospora rubra]|uniref:hypothetical protein n=1 Tax=Polymorphospora rubra TaxID=338584 RepID=UPI00340C2C94